MVDGQLKDQERSESSAKDNTAIILVRPEFLGNIGSVARVMKNFGFRDLRLVDAPRNYKDAEARMMAVGAFDILKRCQRFTTLEAALEDVSLAVATSSGRRRKRQVENLSEVAGELVYYAGSNKLAIVFGNERSGLTDEEMSLCNRRLRIESSDEFAALNLAQSVGVVTYILSTIAASLPAQPSERPIAPELPTLPETEELFEQLRKMLDNIHFSRRYNKELVLSELRDVYLRMAPTKRENALFKGVVYRLNKHLPEEEAPRGNRSKDEGGDS